MGYVGVRVSVFHRAADVGVGVALKTTAPGLACRLVRPQAVRWGVHSAEPLLFRYFC